jgi:hypothetical protein
VAASNEVRPRRPSPDELRTCQFDPKHAFPSWTRYGRNAPESHRRRYGKNAAGSAVRENRGVVSPRTPN